MEEPRTRVSVVIPTCHRNDLLSKCLDRLAPGMQTLPSTDYEVIVTDDGSKTTAQTMIQERYLWAKWVAGPRKGPAANRNNGAYQSASEWLAFTDDDCLPEPQWLAAFEKHAGAASEVLEGKTTTEAENKGLFYTAPINLTGGYLWSCNMMIKKAVFDSLGGFDEKFPHAHLEDVDFRMRLQKAGHAMQFVSAAVVFHPQRPVGPIFSQVRAHESSYYMSRKHALPLRDFGLHPLLYVKNQLRSMVREARSPVEAMRFFITRSCVEGIGLLVYRKRWKAKYRS